MLVPAYLGRVVLRKKYIQTGQGSEIPHQIFWGFLVQGLFWVSIFAPIRSSPSLETRTRKLWGWGERKRPGRTSCFFPLAPALLPTLFLLDICLSFARLWLLLYRRGFRINTDRFPKRAPKAQASSGVREHAPPGKKNWIFTP